MLAHSFLFNHFSFFPPQAGHLLWTSAGDTPDVAGTEQDTNFYDDVMTNPELVNPGCYRGVCAELDIKHLALNAVLMHSQVEEAEGGAGLSSAAVLASQFGPSLAGSNAALHSFKVLRALMGSLMQSFTTVHDEDTERLILHMYRWLHSTSALMHDPLLHLFVHKVMKKTFTQLVTTFKSLHCSIVYASFSRLIVATNKPSLARGTAFLAYVMDNVSKRSTFSMLTVTPAGLWESLLFADACNYSGLRAVDPDASAPANGDGNGEGDGSAALTVPEPEFVSNWNIGEYLPTTARHALLNIVYDFLVLPYRYMREAEATNTFTTGQERDDHQSDFVRNLVSKEIQRSLLALTTEVRARHNSTQLQSLAAALVAAAGRRAEARRTRGEAGAADSGDPAALTALATAESGVGVRFNARRFDKDIAESLCSTDFPILPGSHLSLTNPALEFVKTVCYILDLDPAVTDAVAVVKSNLLLKIDVKPFSDEARFQNPCLTLVLPEVTCEHCNLSQDLDLCRDPSLFISADDPAWRCHQCAQPYHKPSVELRLVALAQRRLVQYQVQDLVCVRCHEMKVSNISGSCQCSGVYQNTKSPATQRQQLFTLLNIARFHQFDHLRELVEWALMM